MKILLDMNLSPDWVEVLAKQGWESIHWSSVGDMRATDQIIFEWARNNKYVVFTHDLDFGTILAATNTNAPSVIQVRTQDVMPKAMSKRIFQILRDYEADLEKGALITVDEFKARVRILPING
jgi:predicted nuclease of predicted toxin-antitoxin system